ncbi:MAG: HAD family phosphatase [Treponema sp.]|nr:HAD family phosphatase [Treponema sp.]
MIKNIIFDIGNVLVHFRPLEVMKELGMDENTMQAVADATVNSPLWQELDRGVIPEGTVIEMMKQTAQNPYKDDVQRFFDEGTHLLVKSFDYSANWLNALKQKGYKIFLLSNYPVSFFEMHSKECFTFMPYIDGKVVSGYVKVIKPDAEIYSLLLNQYSLTPQECVFIDDVKENIEGAEKAGINGIHFTNYEEAKSKLQSLLDLA